MDCLTGMGLGWDGWGMGDGGLWGVGGRVQGYRVLRLLSSTQILFSILHKIKHKPTFTLCFTQPSKSTPTNNPATQTSLFISNSILHFAQNKTTQD